ncbi:GvpL/GvpF family gas vesicle protein [Halobacillus aidingensis]|uniref:Gas vesicle synthesis protein GvpL/GvpF n=1 Tax=Halobacillus aidingensis TaxID=240303 RepID=A0A1H0HDR5_HALAD|nr:GvpL/GvpF family gas vesicle protein [Halobacillus aidingensis]SDO17288.1 Gas vesicle synthesis protein GvpL/GvpF [Halobacillus aidingensis]
MERLLYLYGITLKEEAASQSISDLKGIDGKAGLEVLDYGWCSAIVSPVDEGEFGEEALETNTQQMEWVQEKAYLHHEILMSLKNALTLIPMKFCTIFQHEESLKKKMDAHEKEWMTLLEKLKGKEEWNIKVFNHSDLLKEQVADHHPEIQKKKEEISQMSKGMQYLQRKKLDQSIEQQVLQEQQKYVRQLHSEWEALCEDTAEKKVWNKNVTGKDADMCWNGAYLIEVDKVETFLKNITNANEQGEKAGWVIEVTGPWPPYHFSSLSKSEVD